MTELYVRLSHEAVLELSMGHELVVDAPDTDTRIYLSCSDAAVETFRQAVQRAMLHMLPVDDVKH